MATILIIDDDPVFADMAKQPLERAAHTVHVHIGPFGATVAAKNPALDLIILDIFMPALQGPDLLELIRQRMPGSLPRVVFCSSMDETPLWELATRHQVDGYISKSADRDNFLKAIDQVLAQRPHPAR